MKTIDEFLSELRRLDVKLWNDGDRLRYKAAKETLTPALLQELRERKAEMREFLHKVNAVTSSNPSPILPVPKDGNLRLSFAQARLWFLAQLEPDSSAYNMPAAYRLTGLLNVTALSQSLSEIVRRHEALRTTFPSVDGQPKQVISLDTALTLPVIDLRELPADQRLSEAQHLATKEAQQLFDLATGPLFRVKLLHLEEAEHMLVVTIHHIVYDGWSYDIFFQELAALYDAFCSGKPSPLAELPIQYADFAVWQRQWLQGEILQAQLDYWKQQLSGSLPILQLPTDRPRPVLQSYQGAKQFLKLPKNLSESLKALSRQQGVTMFMTLLAAFQILLCRYSGQEDIIVGSPSAGRNRMETEGLIGFFVNTLVLRTDLSSNPTFQELLERVRKVTLGAYDHQDLPFEKLVEELQPERDSSRTPLFQVWFNMLTSADNQLELSGLKVESFSIPETLSKFDLTLYIREQKPEIQLELVYNTKLFELDRIVEMLNQYKQMLVQIVAAPKSPIRSYSLVTSESRPLLPDPSAVLPEPRYELVTSMFAAWVTRTPEQPAVCQGNHAWTYRKLAESADALARILLAHDIEQGDIVAVVGPRSFGLIASMMGVFLSGGVLLTIDWNLPSNRQQLMLRVAEAKCLLYVGDRRLEDEWMQEFPSLDIICVDLDKGQAIDSEKSFDFEAVQLPDLAPDDAAYIFFTSGTTGIPKGVLGCHKGLSHFLNWQREIFAIGSQDRSAQLTGLSFDVVLRDIFLPLTSGATLCLLEDSYDLGPERIMTWLERERISVLHTVPSLAQSWLVNVTPGVSLRSLRWLFFAGEPLTETLVHQWREAFPEAGGIVNLYGPTETTLAKCFYQVPAIIPPGVQPVGSPLPETQALVLADNRLCGVGESGEIVLRTPFRSLGYVNAREENQQRFSKNPFRNDERDLLYYTGDRGRYRLDGSLEILGRLDHQVKIRGMRVELGEIEAVLNQYPAVQTAVVILWEDIPDKKRLVAYVVTKQKQSLAIAQLRSFVKEHLPQYMVPSAFVMLDALPLTPNGKLDRRALPAPAQASPESEQAFVAARDTVELQLTKIWEELLGIQPIGLKNNFFDLGGHSLLAVRLFTQIEKIFGKNLPLATLFQAVTIEQLAKVIRQEQGLTPWSLLVPIQTSGDKPPLFCPQGVGGNVLVYRDLARYLGPDQPVYGLQAQGLDGKKSPYFRLEDMAADFINQIRTIQPEGPYFLAGLSAGGRVAFEIAQQLHTQGQKVALLAMFDTSGPGIPKPLPAIPRLLSILSYKVNHSVHKLIGLEPKEKLAFVLEKAKLVKAKICKLKSDKRSSNVKARQLGVKQMTDDTQRNSVKIKSFEHWIDDLNNSLLKRTPWVGLVSKNQLPGISGSLPETLQIVQQANIKASKRYVFKVYPGRITLFRASEQPPGYYNDPQRGFGGLAAEGLELHEVPGLHWTIVREPHVRVLAEKLRDCLAKAQVDYSGFN